MNARPFLVCLLAATLAAAAFCCPADVMAAASSAPKWYNVEIVVFSRLSHSAGASEHWPRKPGLPPLNKALAIAPYTDKVQPPLTWPRPFSALPADAEQLQGVWRRLKLSAGYHPLFHLAWTQPLGEDTKTKPVLIELSPKGKAVTYPAPDVLQRTLPLLGVVTLRPHGHHLRLHVDLIYRAPTHNPVYPAVPRAALPAPMSIPPPTTIGQAKQIKPYQSYRLDQKRVIHTGNLNYFDHPLFGVLALVTPRKSPPAGEGAAPSRQ